MNPDITKKQKITLYACFAVVPAWMLGMILWFAIFSGDVKKDMLDRFSKESFHGKVDSIYRDKSNHNIKTVHLTTGYNYGLWPEWDNSILPRDSISKDKGKLIIKIYRANKFSAILDFRNVVKNLNL